MGKYINIIIMVLLIGITFNFLLYRNRDILKYYYPTDDEFSLIVNSTNHTGPPDFKKWITQGFSQYFTVYPEFSEDSARFVRPVVNLTYYLNYLIWGESWSKYLYFNYLIHALGVALAFYLTRILFACPISLSIVAAFLMLLTPATVTLYIYPSFSGDALAAILGVLSFICIRNKKVISAIILLILALFTKETTILFPLAAAITYLLVKHFEDHRVARNDYVKAILVCTIPMALWLIIRLIFFQGFKGAYFIIGLSFKKTLAVIGSAMLSWPLGAVGKGISDETVKNLLSGELPPTIPSLAILVNLLLIALIIYYAYRLIKNYNYYMNNPIKEFLYLLPWLLGTLTLLVIFGLDLRYGYFLYLICFPCVIYFISKPETPKKITILLSFCCILIVFPQLLIMKSVILSTYKLDSSYIERRNRSKELVSLLQQIGDKYQRIYLVNDVAGVTAGGGALGKFARASGEVVILSTLMPAEESTVRPNAKPYIILTKEGKAVQIEVNVINSGYKYFIPPGSFKLYDVNETNFKRTDKIYYKFPDKKFLGYSFMTNAPKFDYGNLLQVKLLDDTKFAVVYFNPLENRYQIVEPQT